MDVRHHEDPRAFMALAEPFYGKDPLRHTVALTVMVRSLTVEGPHTPRMATLHDNGNLIGVAFRTPPWPIISSGLPTDPVLLEAFLARWLEFDPDLPGASGPRENVEAVGTAWGRVTGGTTDEVLAGRLYRLGELIPPTVPGRVRHATEDDVDLLVDWWMAFSDEAHPGPRDDAGVPAKIRRLFAVGDTVALWEVDGVPVSWAVASAPNGGMSRIGPVYTPPEYRTHGYGSAITAAVSRLARDAGARDVLLFTDLANPTSNWIYRKIGYRPVYDPSELHFSRLPSTT